MCASRVRSGCCAEGEGEGTAVDMSAGEVQETRAILHRSVKLMGRRPWVKPSSSKGLSSAGTLASDSALAAVPSTTSSQPTFQALQYTQMRARRTRSGCWAEGEGGRGGSFSGYGSGSMDLFFGGRFKSGKR